MILLSTKKLEIGLWQRLKKLRSPFILMPLKPQNNHIIFGKILKTVLAVRL